MKRIIFLMILLGASIYLFDLYNPFGIKLFNTKEAVVVEAKNSVAKRTLTARDFFLKGEENLKANNYSMAILNFSKTLELDPNYIEAYNKRALAKDKNGDFDGSKKDYEKYMTMSEQRNTEENVEKKKKLKKLIEEINKEIVNKQYDKAIVDLSNIINSYSKLPDGYVARADVYFILKKYNQALTDYQKALSFGDKSFALYLKLANTKYELGLYKDSINNYLYVLNLKPNYEYVYYKLTGAYIFIEDFNNALKSLKTYTDISSKKSVKVKDYSQWTAVLNKYTEDETIRKLKSNLKKLNFVQS